MVAAAINLSQERFFIPALPPVKTPALGWSVGLHMLLALWLVWPSSRPLELPDQQIIEVSLIAAGGLAQPQEKPHTPPKTIEAPLETPQGQLPTPMAKAEPSPKKPEPKKQAQPQPEKTTGANQLAALSPTAGESPLADTQTTQTATTKPMYNAAYLRNPPPNYPESAKRRRQEGTVMLDVLVSAQGEAKHVGIAQSSGHDQLDAAALSAVTRWKFIAAQQNGTAAEARVIVPIEFKLAQR